MTSNDSPSNDKHGGTGYGISMWSSWLGCILRAHLNYEARKGGRAGGGDTYYTALGTIIHLYLARWYRKESFDNLFMSPGVIHYTDSTKEKLKVWKAGLRVVNHYIATRKPNEFGRVIGVEFDLPHGKETFETLGAAVGLPKYSLQIDLATKVDKATAKRLSEETGSDVPPGVLIVDHKSGSRIDDKWARAMRYRLQFIAYMLGYTANPLPRAPKIVGLLANGISTGTLGMVSRVFIPTPSVEEHAFFRRAAKGMAARKAQAERGELFPEPSESRCFPRWGTPCRWFLNGTCYGPREE